ncbi:IPT/TIG domain-containing protein [Pontibacter mangrovi]|nr:IPT/TIG domain-containing protein [Pontibacter mangrovi]
MRLYTLKHPLLLALFSILLLQACKKDEVNHPEVETTEVTALSPTSARLKGHITNKGDFKIIDYGFVYGYNSDLSETRGAKASLGKDAQVGDYSKDLTNLNISGYNYDRTLYARAYLTNEKGTVFGQVSSVVLPSPNVQGISPGSGKAGDRVTITGNFYSNNTSEVEVLFGSIAAKVLEVSPSKVVVEVPSGISFNSYYSYNQVQVVLRMAGQTYNVTSNFKIISTIKDFTPTTGPLGTSITITGENLPYSSYYYSGYVRVYMNGTEVSVSNYSPSSLQVQVPYTLTSDKVTISVLIDGVTTVLPGEFVITPHTVSSISPASGLTGSSFSVFGNFPYNYNSNISVKLGEIPASASVVSSGQLTVTVPHDLPAGSYKVSVTAGPHTVDAPEQYQVLSPEITGFSPASGGIGKEVVINGRFLPNQYYQVYFGSVAVTTRSYTGNALRVYVPSGIEAGKVKIAVKHGNQLIEAEDEFTVLAPSIASFSPASGVAGSVVTITTSGFTPSSYTAVKFGTVPTSVLGVTENTIRAVVPSNVTGSMKINVVHNGQTLISPDNFVVTN